MAHRLFPDGGTEVPPVPRLSVTPGRVGESPAWPGCDTDAVLAQSGFTGEEIADLRATGAIR
jgi:crotonobetainyl-CoA:carnitine CoA-transferase CaiB-like acyl-CoA transferase